MEYRPVFKKIVKKMYVTTKDLSKDTMEEAISINALILRDKHILQAVNFQQANTYYDMTKIVRHF